MLNKLFKLMILSFAFSMMAAAENKLEDLVDIEGMKLVECRLETVTPLSKYYPSHAHRFAENRKNKSFVLNLTQTLLGFTSFNWCGYVATADFFFPIYNTVDAVAGSWIVPSVTGATGAESDNLVNSYSATWVGIDGFSSQTIEQIGTESDWISGAQQNHAWFEMFPNPPVVLEGFPLTSGDSMSAVVFYAGLGNYFLSLVNNTQGAYALIQQNVISLPFPLRNSAEWIVEAPSASLSGPILPLADFGTINFTDCTAYINGVVGPINSSFWVDASITMINESHQTLAYPSDLSPDGEDFSVTWVRSSN